MDDLDIMTIMDITAQLSRIKWNLEQIQRLTPNKLLEIVIKEIDELKAGLTEQSKLQSSVFVDKGKARKNMDKILRDIGHEFDKELNRYKDDNDRLHQRQG